MPIIKHLIADTFGTHVGKYQGRLKITQKGKTLAQAPLMHLEEVHITSRGVSISSDALAACCERGIPVHFMDEYGGAYASVYTAGLGATVITRREQYRAYDDGRGGWLAVMLAAGKIQNQAATLHYLARNRKDTPLGKTLDQIALEVRDFLRPLDELPDDHLDDLRASILSAEAHAAKRYWEGARLVVPAKYEWTQRETRGATDPINSLLNYGYGILYGHVERCLTLAGLDPFAGFLHADRPGKPSLTLDFIEIFRQIAVDRVVFGLAARDFQVEQDNHHRLTESVRTAYADHILNRLVAKVRWNGARYPLQHVIQMQARELSAFLRGERENFVPFEAEA